MYYSLRLYYPNWLKNKEQLTKYTVSGLYLPIVMAVPTGNNKSVKEYNKMNKYKDLEIEIEKMWLLKTTTVPVILGALGVMKKGTDKCINKIPGSPSFYEIEKIALCGTAHLLRIVLSMWLENITQKRQQKTWIYRMHKNLYLPSP